MSQPHIHAENSAKRFGGESKDYLEIHELLDSSKVIMGDVRHRFITHNTWFIHQILPRIFGKTITNSDGKQIQVTEIAEWHVREDFHGSIPSPLDFITEIPMRPWMNNGEGGAKPPSQMGLADVDEDWLYPWRKTGAERAPKKDMDPDTDPFDARIPSHTLGREPIDIELPINRGCGGGGRLD